MGSVPKGKDMTEEAFHQDDHGKDENMLTQILIAEKISSIIRAGVFLLIGAACVGAFLVRQKRKHDHEIKETDTKQPVQNICVNGKTQAPKVPQLPDQKQALIDEYCDACKAVDGYRDMEAYRGVFTNMAPLFQQLLGLERRHRIHGESFEDVLFSIRVAIQNYDLRENLDENGFLVKQVESDYDERALRRLCEKAEIQAIQLETEKQRKRLRAYRSALNCKRILKQCAPVLLEIVKDVDEGGSQNCLARIGDMKKILEQNGCHVIFADDPRVNESEAMRIDFRKDLPDAVELPGLYTKDANDRYCRIGVFGGTVRGKEHA